MKAPLCLLLLATLIAGAAAHADWRFYSLYSFYIAGADGEPHPEQVQVVVAGPLPVNPLGAVVCGFYTNNFEKRNKGKFIMRGEVRKADGSTESFRGRSGIRRNSGETCEIAPSVGPDDLIVVTYDFSNFPALVRSGPNDEDPDRFLVETFVVSQSGGPDPAQAERLVSQHARAFEEGGP